jgi:hypothetical protein
MNSLNTIDKIPKMAINTPIVKEKHFKDIFNLKILIFFSIKLHFCVERLNEHLKLGFIYRFN